MWRGGGEQNSRSVSTEAAVELRARARLAKKKSILEQDDLSGPGGLECICFNARSVTGKTDELRALMLTRNLDVVAVTET